MSLKIRFHEAARDELRAAAHWYEREREGLGEEFLAAVEQLVERVARGEVPGLAAQEEPPSVQKLLLRRFPYAVYYEIPASRDLLKKCLSSRRRWSSASRRTATPLGIEAGSRASALLSSSSDRGGGAA